MTLSEFRKQVTVSVEDICRQFFLGNPESVKIKKEHVAVKNLVNIIDTTLRLSNEKGFNAMSLRDLSSATGLSMGALYSYFSSKEDLLSLIRTHGQKMITNILVEQLSQEKDPLGRLHRALRVHLYLSELMHQWFYFFFMETKNLQKKDRKSSIEIELAGENMFIVILEEGKARGIFSIENIPLTASLIKALLQDWYLKRWKYSQRKISIEQYADFVIGFIESNILKSQLMR